MEAQDSKARRAAEEEYRTWAQICEDKHGMPWPITQDDVPDATLSELVHETKKLKILGRTPHE